MSEIPSSNPKRLGASYLSGSNSIKNLYACSIFKDFALLALSCARSYFHPLSQYPFAFSNEKCGNARAAYCFFE